MAVAEVGANYTTVNPNQKVADYLCLEFTVTNEGNDTQDMLLTTAQTADVLEHLADAVDDFDVTNVTISIDGGDGDCGDQGSGDDDTVQTYVNDLAADASATVWVRADIPIGAGDGEYGAVQLTAQVATDTGTPGTAEPDHKADADFAGTVQNVFADDACTDDPCDGSLDTPLNR